MCHCEYAFPRNSNQDSYDMPKRKAQEIFQESRKRKKSTKKRIDGSVRRPFATTLQFKTRYFESNNTITTVGGIPNAHIYRVNSLFDFDVTGVGHQPIGRDQMALLYNRYRVNGARVKITLVNDGSVPVIACVHLKRDSNGVTDVGQLIENGLTDWKLLDPTGQYGNRQTLTMNFSPDKFFGKAIAGDEETSAQMDSNPTIPCYLHVSIQPTDDSTSVTCRFIIEADFACKLTDPVALDQS